METIASVERITTHVTQYIENSGIACTEEELTKCINTLLQLHQSVESVEQSLLIFDEVAKQQITKEHPWLWVCIELEFECIVADFLFRHKAILSFTERATQREEQDIDFYLDIHNERMKRFEKYMCICGHPAMRNGKPIVIGE